MPHVVAKVRTGYSEARKRQLARALSSAIVNALDCPMFDVSVGVEEIGAPDWSERVHQPDILGKPETIYKRPGC